MTTTNRNKSQEEKNMISVARTAPVARTAQSEYRFRRHLFPALQDMTAFDLGDFVTIMNRRFPAGRFECIVATEKHAVTLHFRHPVDAEDLLSTLGSYWNGCVAWELAMNREVTSYLGDAPGPTGIVVSYAQF